MSVKVASLYADIGAKTDSFEKGAKRVKDELKNSLLPGLEKARVKTQDWIGANAGLIAVAVPAVMAVGKALQFSVQQAAEAEMASAKLDAVLKSTGGAAGLTADELDEMATSLSRVSTYDDEAIKGSEALLLTFTKIGREVFPEAQQAILDMSAALGQDLQSSTIQLGKALNDPIKGVTALQRVGVSFTAEQRDMIEALVKSGRTLDAQKMILHELSVEFGGQALAASKTYTGQMIQLKNEVGNLGEAIGSDLLPEVRALVTDTKDLTIWVTDNVEAIRKWGTVAMRAANPIVGLSDAVRNKWRELREDKDATDEATDSTEDLGDASLDLSGVMEGLTVDTKEQEDALKALTDEHRAFFGLIGDIQSAEENYVTKAKDLLTERVELEQDKAEEIAKGWAMDKEKIEDYDKALAENTAQTKANEAEFQRANMEIISGLVERKLMQDGVLDDAEFEWLLQKRQEWGLYSADVVEKARAAWKEADRITASVANIPSNKTITITTNLVTTHADLVNSGGPYSQSEHHAAGGSFEIPSSYGYEGFRMGGMDTASGGEKLTITPKGGDVIDYDRLGLAVANALQRVL